MEDTSAEIKERELQNLRAELDGLRHRFSLLSDLSRRISSSLDLGQVLQEVVDGACQLTGARYGALGVFNSSGQIQQFITHGITSEERQRIGDLPQGLGILGYLQNVQQPLRLSDLTRHPRSVGFPPNHPPMTTFLGAPIHYGNEPLGNLYLTEKERAEEFTPEDEQLLVVFASQAAAAIHNAQLHRDVELERQRLNTILDHSPNGIVFVDALSGQVKLNTWAQNTLQISSEDLDSNLEAFNKGWCAPDGTPLPPEQTPLSRSLQGQFVPAGELLLMRSDGKALPAFCGAAPVQAPNGQVVGAVMEFQDMTAIKLAQQQIESLAAERGMLLEQTQEEQKRLQALVDTSPVGVLVVEAGSRNITLANREAQRILGRERQVGHTLDEGSLVHRRPDGRELDPQDLPLERALARGESVHAEELRFEFPDGYSVPTLVNATPLYSADGKIVAAIAAIQDMTPLEDLERLRNEFLGIVSHELRTPLTAIKGSAATVLGSRHPMNEEETRELFEIIDEQADRLRDLVDNLMDMTRIEAGALSISPEPNDLGEMVQEAVATFQRSGGSQDIQLELPEEPVVVKGDRRRVVQVLANLVSNAAKFSPETAPITITAEPDTLNARVQVHDQGRGIPQEMLPHLFKKFSQVHDDSGRNLSGTGLGLAICKGIVEAHGGRIWVDSPGEGQGATFSFTLPLADGPAASPTIDVTRRDQHLGRVHRSGERTRVLAVDDEPRILRYLERTLNEAGYHPIVTPNPSEVISMVQLEEPDLVLLDMMLPGISGLDLLQNIREFSGVPVIFLSAQNRDEDAVQALNMGADDYITKPFSPSELLARIEAALRRRLTPDQMEVRPPFALGDLSIHFAERQVCVADHPVSLSATEYKVLYELATHAGLVLTHDQLLQRVWGPEYSGETELVRSFIRNLRRKLGDDARNPSYIFTEPQVGYRMPKP